VDRYEEREATFRSAVDMAHSHCRLKRRRTTVDIGQGIIRQDNIDSRRGRGDKRLYRYGKK